MRQTKTSSILLLIVLILFVTLFVFFMYTFLHEGGHALAGLLFGQSLTEFDVSFWDLSAHAGLVGGELTESQFAVEAVAGAGLPLLVWAIFISLVPHKSNFTLEILKLISSMAVINTLLPWIVLPVLFLLGNPPSDDVTHFLLHSQMPPLLLMAVAIALYISGWLLFLSKIDGFRNALLLFSTTDGEKLTSGMRKTISATAGTLVVCVFVVIAANLFADQNPIDKLTPPQDFTPVAQIDLSTREYPKEILAEFTLDKTTYVAVFLAIRNINTAYFDLSITGPDGFRSTMLHGEGYNSAQDGGLWEKYLPAGAYQIILTSHQSPGTASVYMKIQ